MKVINCALVLILLFRADAAHAINYGIELGARSYVRGASARFQVAHDSLFWGKKTDPKDWKFGLLQAQAGVATHGQLDAAISLFPISFLEINYQKKWTQRFSAPSNFDCIAIQCYGPIERDVAQMRIALAYEKLVSILSYSRQWTKVRNTNESVFDDLENILMLQNSDAAEIKSAFLGLNMMNEDNLVLGLAARSFEYEASKVKNELVGLAVTRDLKWEDKKFKIFGLIGLYKSDYSKEGLSLALAAQYTWGDAPLALF